MLGRADGFEAATHSNTDLRFSSLGGRYAVLAFLPFVFDEEAEKIRLGNLKVLAPAPAA